MKKLLAMLLMVVMSVSLLAGCGGNEESEGMLSDTFTNEENTIVVECSEDGSFTWTEGGETRTGTYRIHEEHYEYNSICKEELCIYAFEFYFDGSEEVAYLGSYETYYDDDDMSLWLTTAGSEEMIEIDLASFYTDTEE